jgi:hypothetical protein
MDLRISPQGGLRLVAYCRQIRSQANCQYWRGTRRSIALIDVQDNN